MGFELIPAILTALLPAAADGVRGLIGKFTDNAGARPQNIGEAVQLMDADTRRLQTIASLEGNAESYKWVAAIRQLQRPVICGVVTTAWFVVSLGAYDDFAKETVGQATQLVWFYLFGERGYMALKGAKK